MRLRDTVASCLGKKSVAVPFSTNRGPMAKRHHVAGVAGGRLSPIQSTPHESTMTPAGPSTVARLSTRA